jgi:hypothetical protein
MHNRPERAFPIMDRPFRFSLFSISAPPVEINFEISKLPLLDTITYNIFQSSISENCTCKKTLRYSPMGNIFFRQKPILYSRDKCFYRAKTVRDDVKVCVELFSGFGKEAFYKKFRFYKKLDGFIVYWMMNLESGEKNGV